MAQTAEGSRLYLSVGTPATNDLAGVAALTWTEVGLIEEIADIEQTRSEQSVTLLSGKVIRLAGAMDRGILDMTVLTDGTDAGQVMANAAFEANTNVVYAKLSTFDGNGNPVDKYSSGQIMSYTQMGLNADSIMKNGVTLSLNEVYA